MKNDYNFSKRNEGTASSSDYEAAQRIFKEYLKYRKDYLETYSYTRWFKKRYNSLRED